MDLVAHQPHVTRPRLESIVDELVAERFVTRHGFKNQFGGAEGLYRLIDYRMIYGNFPIASQLVEVRHGSLRLGDVPAANLLRINKGDAVLFAGQRWRVRASAPKGIDVEPASGTSRALDFQYRVAGPVCDASVIDRIWLMVQEGTLPITDLAGDLRPEVGLLANRLRCPAVETVPCFASSSGTYHLTFAGRTVNRAIALMSGEDERGADDVGVALKRPPNWSALPPCPEGFAPVLHQLGEQSPEQTLFQSLLPQDLQRHELEQRWLKDTTVAGILSRLTLSTCRPIDAAAGVGLARP